jgi:long-chain acyl-CoA synthetase
MSAASRPWLSFYGGVPQTLEYPRATLYDAVAETARRVPAAPAFDFLGRTRTYGQLLHAIDKCADALAAHGLGIGDRITISTPTCPQGVIAFYAAVKLGAVPSMIHPLSTPAEIGGYLNLSRSRMALTLDGFYGAFAAVREVTPIETLVLTRIPDELDRLAALGFRLTRGRKIARVPAEAPVVWWSDLMGASYPTAPPGHPDPDGLGALLYSGGTTGNSKAIMLSHQNIVSEGIEVAAWVGLSERDVVLAVLPIFHGFGLAVLVNASLMAGAKVVMVPLFSPEIVAKLIRRKRPTVVAGVPTLYEALTHDRAFRTADLSSLRAAFSGADTLPRSVKEEFESLVAERGGRATLLEGYGLTETVSAIMCTPSGEYREGSIGVPFPDTLGAICRVGEIDEVEPGEEGEICLSGPPVMLGYLDNPEATAEALKLHPDGRLWLHTGDLGRMDEDGFFYFRSRLKRMIKSSGFNVYPNEVEVVLEAHPAVVDVCVIGVPDVRQGQRVVGLVKLRDPTQASPELAKELIAHCRRKLIKWSCPREILFRTKFPLTKVGKVDYVALERDLGPQQREQDSTPPHSSDRVRKRLQALP